VAVENGVLRIVREGRVAKFVRQVEQVSFAGHLARDAQRDVLFVTERAVFRLQPDGVELIEVAPGIDLQRDILDQMEFLPLMRSVAVMKI
jgi:propionate CoA-transferase